MVRFPLLQPIYKSMEYINNLPNDLEIINNVIVRKHAKFSSSNSKEEIEFMQALTSHLINNPDPTIVPIYRFEFKGIKSIPDFDGIVRLPHQYEYSYDMKRLYPISDQEGSIIDIVGDGYSWKTTNPTRSAPSGYSKSVLLKSQKILDNGWKNNYKLMIYLEQIIKHNRYWDLHGGNIMKDENGDYKLIDLEGFIKTPINIDRDGWISTLKRSTV